MRRLILAAGICLAASSPAFAQGIDCKAARAPIDRAICASPQLVELDRQMAAAYAQAVAGQPDRAAALRTEQLAWIRSRNAACNLPAARLPRCLADQTTARLAQLTPAPAAQTPPAPAPAQAPVTAAITPAPAPAPVSAPASRPAAPKPAIPPGPDPLTGAASLQPATFAPADETDAELRVTAPGRFTIAAHSTTGVALQLIDQLTGPGDVAGQAGTRDGRLDVLLDVGVYRLRAFAAPGASGQVRVDVTPFHDAAPPRAVPEAGATSSAELRDGEQRAFWLLVPPSGDVLIEAAGRALADLRLWRNGRELTALTPVPSAVEPVPTHTMTDLRLSGKVEPGVYLVTAFGGPALPWADGNAAMPFHLRAGLSSALDEGWAGGPVGPFGSERFRAPAFAGVFRLDLPQAAEAGLSVDEDTTTLAKTSREPHATLDGVPGHVGIVEVRGAEGQAFTLRASAPANVTSIVQPGRYFISAVALGAGGDEPPATVALERTDKAAPPRIVGSNLPRLAPGAPWRGRFNLRGPVSLIFQNAVGGPVAVTTSNLALDTNFPPTSRYDLPADVYDLRLRPAPGVQGVVDVTVGPPGLSAPLATPMPPDPVVPFGVQTVGPGESLQLMAQSGPGMQTGLIARPVPVALAEGPLFITQMPGAPALSVPVTLAAGGTLAVSELGGAAIAVADAAGGGVTHALTLPPTDRPRTVVLAWRRAATRPDIPAPPPEASVPTLQPGHDVPFDLAGDERRGFALQVPQGGLYRIETLGRLHTTGQLASAFVPQLGTADANGFGENMLLQNWLRAGRYRVDVSATASAGHLAVRADPAPLAAGPLLAAGSSVRATMPAGSGVAFPVEIAADGQYHLDLLSLGNPFTVRLDDADGWPMITPGPQTALDLKLRRGTYRLLVSPEPVQRRVVARLQQIVEPAPITGHGPHALPFAAEQAATWHEPPGANEARTPDVWTFDLAAPAQAELSLADGMIAELHGPDGTVIRFARRWSGQLDAGAYRLETTSLGRNDRLDYTVKLETTEIQPGETRSIALPATIPFTLATPRVVALTSWGTTPVKAVLRRMDGTEVVRTGARPDDWNIALSRPLPAGAYQLELAASVPPAGSAATPQDPGTAPAASDTSGDDSSNSDNSNNDSPNNDSPNNDSGNADASGSGMNGSDSSDSDTANSANTDDQAPQTPPASSSSSDPDTSGGNTDTSDTSGTGPTVEIRFALPDDAAISVQPIAGAAPGRLVAAQAESAGAAVLSLERQDRDGWSVVALDEGAAPWVAALADGGDAAWRVRAWPVDGTRPVTLHSAALSADAQAPGPVALRKLDGLGLAAAHVATGSPGVFKVAGATAAAAGWPGHAATAPDGGQTVLETGTDLWLVSPAPASASVAPMTLDAAATVTVPGGGLVPLPGVPAAPGRFRVWLAEAGAGQPVLVGGAPQPVASHSAVAPAANPAALRAAGDAQDLPVQLQPLDLALLPEAGPGLATLPPRSALPVRLPRPGRVSLALAPGSGALTDGGGAWAGDAPLARDLFAAGVVTLVNTTAAPAPVALRWTEEPPAPALAAGRVTKRFYGAAGSFDLPVTGVGTAVVAGDATLQFRTADGRLREGRTVLTEGEGVLTVTHGTGPVVLTMSAPGASPWPSATPHDAPLPGDMTLEGPAMALSIAPQGPVLLHATTTAPVLLGLGDRPPELFPAGAEFHRAVPPGPTVLRLYSPDDGPLAGTLSLAAEPIRPAREGVGDTVAVPPGGSAAFGFVLSQAATVGVGVRAEPDRAEVRLLDGTGAAIGQGVAQLQSLPAGRYVLEARVPPDAPTTLVRPALVGITPRGNGPPPDVVHHYLELVGLPPAKSPVEPPMESGK